MCPAGAERTLPPPPLGGDETARRRLASVQAGARRGVLRGRAARTRALEQIGRFLADHDTAITAALQHDTGMTAADAEAAEIGPVSIDVDQALDHLDRWLRPRRFGLPLTLRPGRAFTRAEPVGSVLVIAPRTAPLSALLGPLVTAIAAGNTVVLKPSECSPATARLLDQVLTRSLGEQVLQVADGGPAATRRLLDAGFDHVVLSGSQATGRDVARVAAGRLMPVTLDVGGRSPAIVTPSADIAASARRIMWGKCIAAGQSCLAPDHVLVPRPVHDRFVAALRAAVVGFHGFDPATSPDYGRVISDHHLRRLLDLLPEPGEGTIAHGGRHDRATRYLEPTVVTGLAADHPLLSDEVLGPILPVIAYDTLDEAIDVVASQPAAPALYPFGRDRAELRRVLDGTVSGSVTVNHTMQHRSVPDLPVEGGSGPLGTWRGEAGFRRLTRTRPTLERSARIDPWFGYPRRSRSPHRDDRT